MLGVGEGGGLCLHTYIVTICFFVGTSWICVHQLVLLSYTDNESNLLNEINSKHKGQRYFILFYLLVLMLLRNGRINWAETIRIHLGDTNFWIRKQLLVLEALALCGIYNNISILISFLYLFFWQTTQWIDFMINLFLFLNVYL